MHVAQRANMPRYWRSASTGGNNCVTNEISVINFIDTVWRFNHLGNNYRAFVGKRNASNVYSAL